MNKFLFLIIFSIYILSSSQLSKTRRSITSSRLVSTNDNEGSLYDDYLDLVDKCNEFDSSSSGSDDDSSSSSSSSDSSDDDSSSDSESGCGDVCDNLEELMKDQCFMKLLISSTDDKSDGQDNDDEGFRRLRMKLSQ